MTFNLDLWQEQLDSAGIPNYGARDDGTFVETPDTTEAHRQQAAALAAAHNPAQLSTKQTGLAQLTAFLDSRADNLRYADYFYRLQKRLLDLWRDKPNLTNTTIEVVAALRGNRETDSNHAGMYDTFLWYAQRVYGVVLVLGDLPPTPTQVQAQAINQAAYNFMVNGVTMANMLLENRRD